MISPVELRRRPAPSPDGCADCLTGPGDYDMLGEEPRVVCLSCGIEAMRESGDTVRVTVPPERGLEREAS